MKKYYIILPVAAIISGITSCKKVEKDPLDYYPDVQTVSAIVLDDGSVEITGNINDPGSDGVEYAGFCMDTINPPGMLSNQQIVPLNGSQFKHIYDDFDMGKTYYFRAWAANGYGYSLGNTIALSDIQGVPVVAPCTPTLNTLNLGSFQPVQGVTSVSVPASGMDGLEFTLSTTGGTYFFVFGSPLKTKIYSATTNTHPGPGRVHIYFYSGFISGTVSEGASIYVNQNTPSSWTITMCNIPYKYNSNTFYMTSRFTCPY